MSATNAPFDHPWIDGSLAPIWVTHLPASGSDEELGAFLDQREAWIKAATARYGWIVDMTHLLKATPSQRRMFADHLGRVRDAQREHCFGVAVITPQAWMRGVLTAITWFQSLPYEVKTFGSHEDGLAWLTSQTTQ